MLKYRKLLLRPLKPQPYSCLCNCSTATNAQHDPENIAPPSEVPTLPKENPYMPTSRQKLRSYLNNELHLYEMLPFIPDKYLKLKRKDCIENLYLIDAQVAKDVVSQILPIIQKNTKQIVCETNAGLGLIGSELLDQGWPMVRLYEVCVEFRAALKEFNKAYPGRVELFSKDLYHAYSLKHLDNIDNGHRIEQILRDVPKKNWSDDHVMTIIGPMPKMQFIKYLMKALILQTDIAKYGRPQIFAFMVPKDFIILTANNSNNLHTYQYWSVLFNLFFDWRLLKKYTRKAFLPWEQKFTFTSRSRYASRIDADYMYLVQLEFKKQLPVEPDQLLHLYYFVKNFFGRGANPVIPTLEKWFPGFGLNIFLPQYEHDENFPRNIDLYTTFGQLNPQEIVCLFKEFVNHSGYENSPFVSMIDAHLVKTETIESDMVIEGDLDKETVEELEEKFVT